MKIVIVGGVAGGASTAARLRRLDEDAEIVILERTGFVSYANCGLPYYVGGVIADEDRLTLQTPGSFRSRFDIDVRVRNEAVSIDRDAKTVRVRRLDDGSEYDEGYDVAIGSRYVSGVNVVNWPIGRVLMSYFASKYVQLVTGFKVNDTTAGFKCYKRRVLETIELDKVRFKGYAFQIEMKFTAYKIGFKIKEVPVIFVNRREGTSKMSGGIFSEAFFGVMRLRWDGWTRKYPKIK